MARSTAEIKNQMVAEKNAQSSLSGFTSNSQTSRWGLFLWVVAQTINIFEQMMDVFKSEVEDIQASAKAGTQAWVRWMVQKFQYNATTTQVAQLNTSTLVVEYPVVNTAFQIITRVATQVTNNKTVLIKVAKSDPPTQLSGAEQTSLQGYVALWGVAGVTYQIVNEPSDKIEIAGTIFYDGQYNSVIQTAVEDALVNYLATLEFNGIVSVQDVIDAIQAVSGVLDVNLSLIKVRRDSVSYASGTTLYSLSSGINGVQYQSYAGYITEETTSSHTFADTLTYSPVY
jgi:hypothetical protein